MRKTKIICTVGPAVSGREMLISLIQSGMNVARFNFSHGTHESQLEYFRLLKQIRQELDLPIAAMLDTKGPEIRTGLFENGLAALETGAIFTIKNAPVNGTGQFCSTTYPDLYKEIQVGARIFIDDGLIELDVDTIEGTDIVCTVKNGGILSNNKGVNLPDTAIAIPFLSGKDRSDILFGIEEGFDYIACSFVRSGDDVKAIRSLLTDNGGENIGIIAKIENRQGLDNLDEIISLSDGIMVARGDLGVEIPANEVPICQKDIVKKCRAAGKIVIIATQMLDSMMRNPRPTRAEVNDVANAIFDGASAVMLSGETASGKYPLDSLCTMAGIADKTEAAIDYWRMFREMPPRRLPSIGGAICRACCATAMDLDAKIIVTVTQKGTTARGVSGFYPQCPILALTTEPETQRKLALVWGVHPMIIPQFDSTDQLFAVAKQTAKEIGLLQSGDIAVITAGVPVGVSGSTNLIKAIMSE